MSTTETKQLLSLAEAAEVMSVSRATAYRLASRGEAVTKITGVGLTTPTFA